MSQSGALHRGHGAAQRILQRAHVGPRSGGEDLRGEAGEERVDVPTPHDRRRVIPVPAEAVPHVGRGVGVVGRQGTEVLHEQAPWVTQHDRPHELERPITPQRIEEQQHRGIGVHDGDRPALGVEREREKPERVRAGQGGRAGAATHTLPIVSLRRRQPAQLRRDGLGHDVRRQRHLKMPLGALPHGDGLP